MSQILRNVDEISREEWLDMRRKSIGGSDAAAVLGVSRYSDAAKVYADKKGLVPDDPENSDMRWGRIWERLIIEEFQRKHPELKVLPGGFWRSDSHEFMHATPDGLCFQDGKLVAIIEAKKPGDHQRPYWGVPGTDDIPREYHVQGDHNMIVVGVEKCFYPVLIGKSDYREYEVKFDGDLAASITYGLGKFWTECILADTMPEVTGSRASTDLLKALYPKDERPIVTIEDKEAQSILQEVMKADLFRKEAGKAWEKAKNRAIALMEDAAGLELPGLGRVTYKKSKDGETVDYKSILAEVREHIPEKILTDALKAHTKVKVGSRRFLATWEESDES